MEIKTTQPIPRLSDCPIPDAYASGNNGPGQQQFFLSFLSQPKRRRKSYLSVVIIFILFSFIAAPRRSIYTECGGRRKVQVIVVVVVVVLCYGRIDRRQKTKHSRRIRRSQTRRKCSTKTMANNGRPMKYDRP